MAIVGASVRAAAQSALRAGFDVVGADLFADADLDGVCPITKVDSYPDGLADWLDDQEVDAWMYTGAMENYPELIDRMAGIAPLWGVSGEPLRRCRDPLELQDILSANGVAFPETLPLGVLPPARDGWLAKTYRHSAGAGVWRYGEQPDDAAVFAQRHVEGRPVSAVYALSCGRATLLAVTAQLMSRSGCDYRGSVGPLETTDTERSTLERLGRCLAQELNLCGLVGTDLVLVGAATYVVEINPRWTASLEVVERSVGRSAIESHAGACRGEPIAAWTDPIEGVVGKRVVFADRDVEITRPFVEWLVQAGAGDRPRCGERIAAGSPVCTVFAMGADEVEPCQSLERVVRATEQRLYD